MIKRLHEHVSQGIESALKRAASPERAKVLAQFFKTGPGDYAHGDRFLGVTVPQVRAAVRAGWPVPEEAALVLIESPFHECRLAALIALVMTYQSAPPAGKKRIARIYLSRKRWINNWDLVDVSAYHIFGAELVRTGTSVPLSLIRSASLWDRRIAMVSTYAFIKKGDLDEVFRVAGKLLNDQHDLIHKACGWMLREAGKRDIVALRHFLDAHASLMPRTMLRYAIERMTQKERARFMVRAPSPTTGSRRKIK